MTSAELKEAALAGEDVLASSAKNAETIAQKACAPGKKPIKEIDAHTGKPHFHPNPRTGSHIIWGIAGSLTFTEYAQGNGTVSEVSGFILDLINPLSIPQDVLDIGEMFGLLKKPCP